VVTVADTLRRVKTEAAELTRDGTKVKGAEPDTEMRHEWRQSLVDQREFLPFERRDQTAAVEMDTFGERLSGDVGLE
jgi:hypothetical protein